MSSPRYDVLAPQKPLPQLPEDDEPRLRRLNGIRAEHDGNNVLRHSSAKDYLILDGASRDDVDGYIRDYMSTGGANAHFTFFKGPNASGEAMETFGSNVEDVGRLLRTLHKDGLDPQPGTENVAANESRTEMLKKDVKEASASIKKELGNLGDKLKNFFSPAPSR